MPSLQSSVTTQVTIEGTTLSEAIESIQLDQYIDDHHELVVTVRQANYGEGEQNAVDLDTASGFLGKSLSLSIEPYGSMVEADHVCSFVGIVTKVDMISSVDAVHMIVIHATSPTILLDMTKVDFHWKEKKDSDIINDVIGKYKITKGDIKSTGTTHEHVYQHNQTDYEFLQYRAARQGLFTYYDGSKFIVGPPVSQQPTKLAFRENLGNVSIGVGVDQPEYTGTSYHYTDKKFFDQKSKSSRSSTSMPQLGSVSLKASEQLFSGEATAKITDSVNSPKELDNLLLQERARAFDRMVGCRAESIDPSVKVGHCVQLSGVGDKLEGVYYVSSVSHTVDPDGYANEIVCRPVELAAPQIIAPPEREARLQSAIVIDNADPEELGRVKVKLAWLPDDESPWLRVLSPHAGANHGWYVIPEIDDEVLVGYLHGDYDQPVVLGSLFNGKDRPPEGAPNADNNFKLFSTRSGAQIKISDESGSEQISVTTGDEANQIVLDSSGPSITIESDGDIVIDGKSITLKAQQNLDIESGTALGVKAGSDLSLEASAGWKAKANAMMDINTSAVMTIKGSLVKIN